MTNSHSLDMCPRLLSRFSPGRNLCAPRSSFQNRLNLFLFQHRITVFVSISFRQRIVAPSTRTVRRLVSLHACNLYRDKAFFKLAHCPALGSLNEPKLLSDTPSQSDQSDRIQIKLNGVARSIPSRVRTSGFCVGSCPGRFSGCGAGITELTNLPIIVIKTCICKAT